MDTKSTKVGTKDTKKSESFDLLSRRVIGCAIEVHRALGPGLLESAYEQCLAHELGLADIPFKRQVPAALKYKGLDVECGYRMDMLIDETIVVELKSVDQILSTHEAQILTYMKLAKKRDRAVGELQLKISQKWYQALRSMNNFTQEFSSCSSCILRALRVNAFDFPC